MPVQQGFLRTPPAAAADLEERLYQELEGPSEQGHPLVFFEPAEPAVSHIFVVWDAWASMSQQDRSEIIRRAYERAKGQSAALKITVAMGLTVPEAERMGIRAR